MIFLLIVSIIWAFSFGIIKGTLTGIDSNLVSFARLFIPLIIFAPFLRLKKIDGRTAIKLAIVGMIQYGVMYITYIYSFRFLKAYEVALFTILTPLYVTLVYNLYKKKFSWVYFGTTLTTIIGAAIVVQFKFTENTLLSGFLILQISNFCFALGQIAYKEIMAGHPDVKDQQVFGLLYLGATIITALATLVFTDLSNVQITSNQWMALLYLGMVSSGFGFFLWNMGARQVNAGSLAIFNDLKIPLAIAVSLVFFKEEANLTALVSGGIIILLSLAVNEWVNRREIKPTNTLSETGLTEKTI